MRKYDVAEWKGLRYGHLTIEDYSYKDKMVVCRCDCGNEKKVKPTLLFMKKYVCCGLNCKYHQEQYDRSSKERLNRIWRGMKQRCYKPKSQGYRWYGARGITICDEWREDYQAFKSWALENGYADDLTIDRIDSDGNYEPSNCRWATYKQQSETSRNPYTLTPRPAEARGVKYEINGEWHTIPDWCSLYGKDDHLVRYRIKHGYTLEEALTEGNFTRYRGKPTKNAV